MKSWRRYLYLLVGKQLVRDPFTASRNAHEILKGGMWLPKKYKLHLASRNLKILEWANNLLLFNNAELCRQKLTL